MKPQFSFGKQQNIGAIGETMFLEHYANLSPKKTDGRIFDIVLGDGTSIELKTDTYSMSATANMFVEHISNTNNGKLGGPWRAEDDKVDFFVYLFIHDKAYFWFKPSPLRKRVEELIDDGLKPKTIRNTSWETIGYAVDRALLDDLVIRKDKF